ncbi:MAG: HAMP domain-containing histidine kinase [Eubacterium sp.]|nr:HAMP domain-containing histidine kinase [Eubacterium sp.]
MRSASDPRQDGKGRRSKLYMNILLPAVGILLLAVLLVYGNLMLIRKSNEQERSYMAEMAGVLRKELPGLSDAEIMQLIKKKEYGYADPEIYDKGNVMLQRYGYDEDYFDAEGSRLRNRLLIFNLAMGFLFLLFILILYILHRRRVHREVQELQGYFAELNRGSYDLKLTQTEEGDLSLLQSDIFKITQLLRTSAEESREKSEDLSRWLADISHQLKTPIASMRIHLDNLMDDPEMPEELRKEFIRETSIQLEWVSSLVQILLKLAPIDAGTVELKKEEMSLKAVAEEARKKLGILSEIAGVEVVWENETKGKIVGPEEIPEAKMIGDPDWQMEAVSNILKNCIEHSRTGEKVYLSLQSTTVFAELTIRDTGEGIPEEDLPHIFERFYRAANARRESVGIGLSLASSIIKNGGGRITVTSEKGEGSTFRIRYFL